ncbi:MAG: hypothetical protein B6I24_03750 [Bacteroidetes bacterium 4572_128]|nr:MAG: hypothetical protein B6I24_03750 [Bacteroidetes bacterium 4572_128]
MKIRKTFFYLFIYLFLIGVSCQEENDYKEVDMIGTWDIDVYLRYKYVNDGVFKMDTFPLSGKFIFEKNGIGRKILLNKTSFIKWTKEKYAAKIIEDEIETSFVVKTDLENEQTWIGNTYERDSSFQQIRIEHTFFLERKKNK